MINTFIKYSTYLIQEIDLNITDDLESIRLKRFIKTRFIPLIEDYNNDGSIESNYHLMTILDTLDEVIRDAKLVVYKVWQESDWYPVLRQRKIDEFL